MTPQGLLKLAKRFTLADRHQPEWRALLLTLTIAIATASLMALVADQLEKGLNYRSAQMLGADLKISSTRPIPDEWLIRTEQSGLNTSEVVRMSTMVSAGDQFLLSNLRAVDQHYPLQGRITTAPTTKVGTIPSSGSVWVEQAVLDRMKLSLGDQVQIGYKTFQISHRLVETPDPGRGLSSFQPQLIINRADLDATRLVVPGARIRHQLMVSGPTDALNQFENHLADRQISGLRITKATADDNLSSNALSNTSDYLRLGAALTLLLSALTLALSQQRFVERCRKRVALLQTLGLDADQTIKIFAIQWLLAWLVTSVIGSLIALLLFQGTLAMIGPLLPAEIPAPSLSQWLLGPLLALIMLAGFGLPPLLAARKLQPASLFSSHYPTPTFAGWLLLSSGALVLVVVFYLYLHQWTLSLMLIGSLALIGWSTGSLGQRVAHWLAAKSRSRLALGRLLFLRVQQQRNGYRIQIPVMTLLLTLATLTLMARFDLLSRWQDQLPSDTPDHFLINIQPNERQPVLSSLTTLNVSTQAYPMVPGRLTGKNGLSIEEGFTPKQQQDNAFRRELSLTWQSQAAAPNEMLEGSWPPKPIDTADGAIAGISVESGFAERLGLVVGDQLQFDVAGVEVVGQIQSVRRVDWGSFQPNFFVIFPAGVLETRPHSFLTSFYAGDQASKITTELLHQFPTLTLIDIRQMIRTVKSLLDQLLDATALIMALTLLAGLVLLYVVQNQEAGQRRYENALLGTLGATAKQCRQLDMLEAALLGLVSGAIATLCTELLLIPLHHYLLKIPVTLHPMLWLTLPLVSLVLFLLLSRLSHQTLTVNTLWKTLRERGASS